MLRYTFLSIFLTLISPIIWSGVTIDGTRIIFPANEKSINIQLRNTFKTPALVQVWIDKGNTLEIPKANEIPFVLNPSLTRIEANKGQIIRLIPTTISMLPLDRESIFWFNLLDIPPENPKYTDANKIKFTVRTRIKLFYRPNGLKIRPNQAYKMLNFQYLDQDHLKINNPSPYYITIIKIENDNREITENSIMIEPFEEKTLQLKIKNNNIKYYIINDLGVIEEFNSTPSVNEG